MLHQRPFFSLCNFQLSERSGSIGQRKSFLVVWQGATTERRLNLLKGESKSWSVLKPMMVKYMGEEGIDQDVIAKEFVSH